MSIVVPFSRSRSPDGIFEEGRNAFLRRSAGRAERGIRDTAPCLRRTEGDSRVPGMLSIMLSFIPWMIYWTLCGIGIPLRAHLPPYLVSICLRDFQLPPQDPDSV
ncbi:MAG: hypothetical protein QXK42_07425 [Candidatus Korarchaeum sp.]